LPAKRLTKELNTLDIATAIELTELTGFCDAAAVGTASRCHTVAGAFNSGVVRAVPDRSVTADVGTAFAWMPRASTGLAATIGSERAAGVCASVKSVVGVDPAAGRVALARDPQGEAGLDRLPCFDGVEFCESAVCGCDTVSLATVVGEDVCGAKEPRALGRDVLPESLAKTLGGGWEFVSVDVDPALDGEVDGPVCKSACFDDMDDVEVDIDGAPSFDGDELVDDELEPDGADGSADATP
jgi:hypothetical protein